MAIQSSTLEPTSFSDVFLQGIINAAHAMSYWEVAAVLLGLAYLILVMRENSLCWYAAFGSTAIYIWLFFDVNLLMESALNVYYLIMAVYGWYQWNNVPKTNPTPKQAADKLPIIRWPVINHVLAIGGVVAISYVSGLLLTENTQAVMPYLDSFTTWGAVLTTYMVVKKVLENWVYWLVINGLSVFLYIDRELYLVALQMMVYTVMVFFGYAAWLKTYRAQAHKDNQVAS